jgi:hypothetical protein
MSKATYTEITKEFEKIMKSSCGSDELELSINILNGITKNKILKTALFRVVFFKEEEKNDISKYIYKIVKGKDILKLLNNYTEEDYKFRFTLSQNN